MEEISQQTEKLLEQEKKPIQEDTFFDKYIAGEKTKGMFNPTAKDVLDVGTDFIPGVSETKDIISLGTNVSKGEYASAGIDLASLVLGAVPIVGDVARRGLKTLTKNVGKSEDIVSKQADEVGESLQKVYGNIKPPTKTTKAYKLFKTDKEGNLYPLFVKMKGNKPLELNKWTKAEAGEINPKTGKVKSSLGDLAYRPGFHGGDLPIATHIGGKKGKVTKPNYRKDNQVWAEVEFGNDVDWQSVANSRAVKNKDGSVQVKTAHITDQVPEGGNYRYKTNPNMTGNWIIGGELKINKVLSDTEVKTINDKAGVADLPRLKDLNTKKTKELFSGGDVMDNEFKRLRFEELEKFFDEQGYYHEQDPRNRMNFFDTDTPEERQNRIQNKINEIKREDALESTGGRLEALPMSREEGLERKKEIEDEDVKKGAKARAAKGGSMSKQMELFNEGGLKDEGGTVDPVSGNDVPPGSTQEEVRDDIPAQLSEGEFVFPADVVRYIGLEKLMMLRQEAKQGLKQMEAMGQMGNSEEATMPDDLPFDETDLDIEDDLEYNTGGVVQAQQGTFVQNPVPMGYAQFQNQGIDPNAQDIRQIQPNMARGVYRPDVGRVYGGFGGQQYTPVSFQDLLGSSAQGAPQTELVKYFNEKTGQTRMIPHIVNADGTRGDSIYPVPEGFAIQEPTEEEKKKEPDPVKVPSAKVQDSGGDSDDSGVGDLGGARTTIGGEEFAISYGLDGTVSITSVDEYNKTGKVNFTEVTPAIAEAIKSQTLGQLSALGKGFGLKTTVFAELAKKMGVDTPRYDKLGNLIDKGKAATRTLEAIRNKDEKALFGREVGMFSERQGFDSMSRRDMERMQENIEKGGTEKFTEKDVDRLGLAFDRKEEKERQEAQAAKEKAEREAYLAELEAQKTAKEKAEQAKRMADAERDRRERERREREQNNQNYDSGNDNYGGDSSIGGEGGLDASSGVGGGGGWTATGGFINKKKMIMHKGAPKKNKRMKRGGLASR
jgi:hypothetical protein